ncbi:polyphosphate kinase [Aureimonas flava]|uniref:Polyphosphate kinase n=1 Tax=Aureimonas flava TaxID=2320271 RepID=A0A3A1WT91_9HYPH|nr:polyphosphate kinase [Aureimonas flava]RIY01464.1 polyphosphate kinase [Aureimonas flava]
MAHDKIAERNAHRPLGRLDMTKAIDKDDYEARLKAVQTRFLKIQQAYLRTGDAAVCVFEGWDAAGKGGTIRRMAAVMDPRGFKVWPIAAPSPEDLRHHYLSRFWQRLPGTGEICVFDRSWYGRVLVERVEGYAKPSEWGRAYDEINDFEKLLTDSGTRMTKVFLYITPDEQLKRFRGRMEDPLKRWKLSYEDFRNRERWSDYEDAANEMLERTSTTCAPWLVVPANDKRYARIAVLEHIAARLSDGVDLEPQPVDRKIAEQFEKLQRLDGEEDKRD